MRTLKKSTALFISVCIVISALTCMLSATIPASANTGTVPQASYTYDFTDATKFSEGAVVSQIPGAFNVSVRDNATSNPWTGAFANMNIFTDTENTAGLGENVQMFKIGNDFTTMVSRSAGTIFLTHPNDKVVDNGDGTKSLSQYPITKMEMDVRLPSSTDGIQRKGFFLTRGTKAATYNAETGRIESMRSASMFGLGIVADQGFAVYFKNSPTFTYQFATDGDKISAIDIFDGTNMNNNDNPYATAKDSNLSQKLTLGAMAVDAEGNALSSDLQKVLNDWFAVKTALSGEELWVHLEASAENATQSRYILTLNLSGYEELRENNSGLPEELRIKIVHNNNYNKSTNDLGLGGFGVLSSQTNRNLTGAAIANLSVEYDISSYYAEAAQEFKTAFLSSYNTLVADILKAEDLTAINAQLSAYDALTEGVKSVLAEDAEVQTKLSTLNDAKAALEGGAYFFDAFEGKLNWEVDAHIDEATITKRDVEYTFGDTLKETNVYSDEAASPEGDADGNAFWGIHTDSDNEYNKALYLRKSFDSRNMNPQGSGDIQTWPSVLYVLKDGIIPQGAEVEKIEGKLYHNATNYKHATGILNYYLDENGWDVATITGAALQKVSKQNAESANYANNDPFLDASGNRVNTVATTFATGQWVDFSLTYIEEKGVYEFTVSGIAADGVSTASLTGYTEKVTTEGGMVDRVGLFHGSLCRQTFDNIAVTIKEAEVVDIAPEVLGARILKQATDNNQNLRIDIDFTKAIADSENIAEYGVILQAGTQTKETLIDANNTTRTVLSYDPAVNAIPEKMIVTIARSAENDGKRVTAIAYVKDSEGNYHYSNNDETNEAGQNIVIGGIANKSVIGVMKSWYSASSQSEEANIATAIAAYAEDNELNADTVKAYVEGYVEGTYDTTSAEYETCKEHLRGVFYKYCSIFV